jgi:hypothetical protein
MSDGTVVKTENASKVWVEDKNWDGSNWISVATGEQFEHQSLYRSRRGRFYVVHRSDWQGNIPHAEWISNEEAVRWLIANDHELPDDLKELEDIVCE